jgi:hypothetical protein
MASRSLCVADHFLQVEVLSMPPIKLTDDEMNAVYAACRPLHVTDRDAFLQAIADALRQRGEFGPGAVYRAITWNGYELVLAEQAAPSAHQPSLRGARMFAVGGLRHCRGANPLKLAQFVPKRVPSMSLPSKG